MCHLCDADTGSLSPPQNSSLLRWTHLKLLARLVICGSPNTSVKPLLNLAYLSPNPVLPPGISVEIRCHLKAESLESCSDLSFPASESSLLPLPVFTLHSISESLELPRAFQLISSVHDKTTVSIDNKSTVLSEVHACFALNHQGERPCCHPRFFLKPLHHSYRNSLDGCGDPGLQPQCSGYWGKRIMSLRTGWTVQ